MLRTDWALSRVSCTQLCIVSKYGPRGGRPSAGAGLGRSRRRGPAPGVRPSAAAHGATLAARAPVCRSGLLHGRHAGHGDGARGRSTGTAHGCAVSVGSSGRAGSVGLAPAVKVCSCLCWGPAEAPQDHPPSLTGRFSGTEDVLQRISAVSEPAGCLQGAVCRWAALQSRLRSSTALPKATERPLPEGAEAVTGTRQDAEGR